jgi:16S rRNA (guanine527-N7)-methyltransferase
MDKLISGAEKLGLHLTREQLQQFEVYYKELVDWNARVNLTSITDYDEVQVKHFLDSLTVAAAIGPDIAEKILSVIDIGTGAGLPGIPLKIVFPNINLTLLEATAKKTKFLELLVTQLGLKDVAIVSGRAEEAAHQPQFREKFDVVLSRAVASLPALVEMTLPFCRINGYFVAQKKGDITIEVAQAQKAIAVMGGHLREIKSIELKEFDDNRCLVIIDKVKATPAKYPRRPGMPEKRPLS